MRLLLVNQDLPKIPVMVGTWLHQDQASGSWAIKPSPQTAQDRTGLQPFRDEAVDDVKATPFYPEA